VTSLNLFGVGAFVFGVLLLVGTFVAPNFSEPGPTQANWVASNAVLAFLAADSYVWGLTAIAAIPFFAILGRLLRSRSQEGAFAAVLLSAIGVVLYFLRNILAVASIDAASTLTAPSATQAAYQVNLLGDALNPLEPLGAACWGFGLILFGALIWRSGIFPNWLAIVAFVGGVAGWAVFPALTYTGQFIGYFFTEIFLPLLTAILALICGAIFLGRARALRKESSSAPSGAA